MREIRLRNGGDYGFQAHFCLHGNAGTCRPPAPMATMAHRSLGNQVMRETVRRVFPQERLML
jgi:hypothetical protein